MMLKLSNHFALQEFTDSLTATELGIANIPTQLHISAMQLLCDDILEPIRKHFNSPVHIISGFRSKELNKAVGGVPNSQHMAGEAADITVKGIRNDDVWRFIILNLNYDQCIAEKLMKDDGTAGWVHVSHKRAGKQRNEALSSLGDKKYVTGLQYV